MFVELIACLGRASCRSPNVPFTRVCLQQGRCVYNTERGGDWDQFVSNTFLESRNWPTEKKQVVLSTYINTIFCSRMYRIQRVFWKFSKNVSIMETLPQPPTSPPLLALSPSPRSHLISLEIPVNAGYLHSNSSPPHQLHNATSEIQNSISLTFNTQVYNRGAVRPCGKIPTFSRFFSCSVSIPLHHWYFLKILWSLLTYTTSGYLWIYSDQTSMLNYITRYHY